jgi:hypothetical protein
VDFATLTHAEARAFYDRFGAKQDAQAFYEGRAVRDLIRDLAPHFARHGFAVTEREVGARGSVHLYVAEKPSLEAE